MLRIGDHWLLDILCYHLEIGVGKQARTAHQDELVWLKRAAERRVDMVVKISYKAISLVEPLTADRHLFGWWLDLEKNTFVFICPVVDYPRAYVVTSHSGFDS